MAQYSGLFNSTETIERKYQDLDFAQMMSLCTGQSGYVPNYSDELKVTNVENERAVYIGTGAAWLGEHAGWWYLNTEPVKISFSGLLAGENKTYFIVLKLDRTAVLNIVAESKLESEGLTKALDIFELPLAKVTVSGDDTNVHIEDVRVPCIRSNSSVAEKDASFTLCHSDMNKFIKCINSQAINVTIPLNSTCELPINSEFVICQYTGYSVTIVPETSGVLLRSLDGANVSDGQYAAFTLRKIAENEWFAVGALSS